jgi:dihydroorotate dehydrogenase
LARPLLFRLDPERAHEFAIGTLARAHRLAPLIGRPAVDPRLRRHLMGIDFPNPVGLAAGFDKYARAVPAWPGLGFGFVEVGTITAHPQPGNPAPRIFRLPLDQALINRLGFNNDGAAETAKRLASWDRRGLLHRIPVGVNIGKSKVTPLDSAPADYLASFEALRTYADYVVVNVSSPNTPGLRTLQGADELEAILDGLIAARAGARPPILVKIAPDLTSTQVDEAVALVERLEIDGIVVSNTTVSRAGLNSPDALAAEAGGLSGAPLRQRSTDLIRDVRGGLSPGRVLIGVGGIFTADDAWEKLVAGADLCQVYTGFVYGGPRTVATISRGLSKRLTAEGVASIDEIVGTGR